MITDALAGAIASVTALPLPGAGQTLSRWRALAALAEQDLVAARLAEAHADALAILSELGGPAPDAGSRWGVWAAEPPAHVLRATAEGSTWCLTGSKAWCSGATLLTHALVTARDGDDRRLFAVDLSVPGVTAGEDEWSSAGMKRADTRTVAFSSVPGTAVGDVRGYLDRPGFWAGGIGVAACWYGGAVGVAVRLRHDVANGLSDPHAAAHLGAVDSALCAARDSLRAAAGELDDHPTADHARLARRIRATTADAAAEVITRVGRALGPGPLATDAQHAQRVADLEVYIRQDHAERDLAALAADVAATPPDWSL
jgi:alkylation response protein AidB-like acyl-CoA dehydrogenase